MQVEEQWKEIKDLSGYYISNTGRLKGKRGIHKTFNNPKGYLMFRSPHNNYAKSVHRLVALHFVPTDDETKQVNHIDGNKQNNCYNNLEWVSCKENIHHAIKNGLRKADINLFTGQLFNKEQLTEIRQLIDAGEMNTEIASIYNCCHSTISKIRRKRNYANQ